jgi:hypothetical protein
MRIEIEHGMTRELAAIDERRGVVKLAEGSPDGLVDAERMRVLHERGEEQIERVLRMSARRQVA